MIFHYCITYYLPQQFIILAFLLLYRPWYGNCIANQIMWPYSEDSWEDQWVLYPETKVETGFWFKWLNWNPVESLPTRFCGGINIFRRSPFFLFVLHTHEDIHQCVWACRQCNTHASSLMDSCWQQYTKKVIHPQRHWRNTLFPSKHRCKLICLANISWVLQFL